MTISGRSSSSGRPDQDDEAKEGHDRINCDDDCKRNIVVSPLAIKLNNFLLWSSSGCVLPYLSVYFLRYTQANSNDVGLFMSISALVGSPVDFILSSLSDRHQAHRKIYLASLVLVSVTLSSLIVPMILTNEHQGHNDRLLLLTTMIESNHTQEGSPTKTALTPKPLHFKTIDVLQPAWFYIIGLCLAFGSLGITTNMNFSDSFSTNAASRQCSSRRSSYGSLRFYGALGWCASNLILSMSNKFKFVPDWPYLLPAWTLFVLLSGANILLVLCWPNRKPFDLSSNREMDPSDANGHYTPPPPPAPTPPGGSKARPIMGIRLHLKIIELIARRNGQLIRFMLLYAVVGFIISTNWYFLFPYLELMDPESFLTIGGYVMVSTYASETVFYYYSSHITSRLSATNGMSAVLFFFAIRYSAYLTFGWWPKRTPSGAGWPLELIILVESLQSLTMGWFDCIFNESALEFALEAEKCVPKLIELKLIDATLAASDQVKNGVKLSILSVSSCFFDGLGVGLGSLIGGVIINSFGYAALWSICALFALTICLLNIILDLAIFRRRAGSSGRRELLES